jgi:amino acid transporter
MLREPLTPEQPAGVDDSVGVNGSVDVTEPSINASAASPKPSGARRRRGSLVGTSEDSTPPEHQEQEEFTQLMVANKQGLGALEGVYVPCMLSIIGVVLFLRLGWAIGQAGVLGVLGMFGFGAILILLTDLSLCALATNGKIRAGGTYYLISRSLGPVFGGAIGVIFFSANAVGIAFYMQGFSDTMGSILGLDPVGDKAAKLGMAVACLSLETMIAIVGSGIYAKCALFIFAIQMFAIFAGATSAFALGSEPFSWEALGDSNGINQTFYYYGPSMETLHSNLWPDYDNCDFKDVFKTIFPALTGIMAGANMSGVLRRPELAIPRGELSAIFCSMATYVIVVFALGSSIPRPTLQQQYLVLSKITYFPAIVTVGIIASTTSSALASIQSASRVVQAIAKDDLIPLLRPLKWECNGEPVAAIFLSVSIATGLLCIGSLDAIAPILTMFFLLTYATTNAACFIHRVSGHPNFRPRFRYFSWHTAVLGGGLCFATMFYLEWLYSVVSIGLMGGLASYISHRARVAGDMAGGQTWGDVGQSIIFHQVRKYLLFLDARRAHVKYWRPQFMVVLHGGPSGNVPMLEFIDNMKKGGLFIIGDTVSVPAQCDPDDGTFVQCQNRRELWHHFLDEAQFKAFIEIGLEQEGSPRIGVANMVMSTGLGGLKPNTLILLFPDGADVSPRYPDLSAILQRWSSSGGGGSSDPQNSSDGSDGNNGQDQAAAGYASRGSDGMGIMDSASMRELTSNSVYEPRADNGCRVTSAYQRELWIAQPDSRTAVRAAAMLGVNLSPTPARAASNRATEGGSGGAAAGGSEGSKQVAPMSSSEYVGIMQDTISSQKHLVLVRSMAELDKNAIAKRLGKFSRAAQDAWVASQSKEEQQRMTERRETLNPWIKAQPVRIDIWVMPWASRSDLMMQLQLSYMLSRDDFWTKQSYLRVCSIVGDFSKLGFDDGMGVNGPVLTKAERHAELHEEVWRKMRIPATIEVFDVVEAAPDAWAACTADWQQTGTSAAAATTAAAAGGGSREAKGQMNAPMSRVLNAAIQSRE